MAQLRRTSDRLESDRPAEDTWIGSVRDHDIGRVDEGTTIDRSGAPVTDAEQRDLAEEMEDELAADEDEEDEDEEEDEEDEDEEDEDEVDEEDDEDVEEDDESGDDEDDEFEDDEGDEGESADEG